MSHPKPDWLLKAKVFWDSEGRTHALPTWPPAKKAQASMGRDGRRGYLGAPEREIDTPRPMETSTKPLPRPAITDFTLQGGVLTPGPRLPSELLLYYVEAPDHDERWVPMSPALVQAMTELAAQHGVTLDWRSMPPTVSAEKVMPLTNRS